VLALISKSHEVQAHCANAYLTEQQVANKIRNKVMFFIRVCLLLISSRSLNKRIASQCYDTLRIDILSPGKSLDAQPNAVNKNETADTPYWSAESIGKGILSRFFYGIGSFIGDRFFNNDHYTLTTSAQTVIRL
jgi:hypothetical protein